MRPEEDPDRFVLPGTTTLMTIDLDWMGFNADMLCVVKSWLLLQEHHIFKATSISTMLGLELAYAESCLFVTSSLPVETVKIIETTVAKLDPLIPLPMCEYMSVEIHLSPVLTKEQWRELVMTVHGLLRSLAVLKKSMEIYVYDFTPLSSEFNAITCLLSSDSIPPVGSGFMATRVPEKRGAFWTNFPICTPSQGTSGGMDTRMSGLFSSTISTDSMLPLGASSSIGPIVIPLSGNVRVRPSRFGPVGSLLPPNIESKTSGATLKRSTP